MPFTVAQALDLLMIIVLAMFVPIGLWRGVLREWVALAGITFGSLLAAEWAGPWGGTLARLLQKDQRLGAFIAGAICFLGSALLIGYGGGATLPFRPDLTRTNRLLGAVLGACNGVLILSGMLRVMQRTLFDDRADSLLLGTVVSRFLIERVGWAQLVLLATLLACVAVSFFRRWLGASPLMEEFGPIYVVNVSEEGDPDFRTVPAPDEPDEAEEGYVAGTDAQPTAVLQLVPSRAAQPRPELPRPAHPAAVPATPPARPTNLVSVPKVVDIARPARANSRPAPAEPAAVPGSPATLTLVNGRVAPAGEPDQDAPAGPPAPPDTAPVEFAAEITCPVCGNGVAARSRFCQHCGHIIGEAERRRVARQDQAN